MKRSIVITKDGSKTIRLEGWDEHYHSIHGAIQESQHVYVKAGLDHYNELYQPKTLKVLEAGFGTGLNALLSYFGQNTMEFTWIIPDWRLIPFPTKNT